MSEETTVRWQTSYEGTYFYVEDVSGVSTYFSINRDNYAPEITVYCSYDGLNWELWGRTGSNGSCCITKMVPANGRLYIKAETDSWGVSQKYNRITHDYLRREYKYNVGGNIMSLFYGDDYIDKVSFPNNSSEYTLAYLFSDSSIVSAEHLVLPVTSLHKYDYAGMFKDCKELIKAPSLLATKLSHGSYYEMFKGCAKLQNAPELYVRYLSNECYEGMFEECSSLCYIKAAFETTPGLRYTKDWVNMVSPTGTFVKNEDAVWDVVGSNGIPYGWTVVEEHMFDPEPGEGDYLDIITEIGVVVEENVPYCGALPGDEYVDIIIQTGATGGVVPHIYIPIRAFEVFYYSGLGIDINDENVISLLSKNENGLYVDENGLGLTLSSALNGGAMSAEQYVKLENVEITDRITEGMIDDLFI